MQQRLVKYLTEDRIFGAQIMCSLYFFMSAVRVWLPRWMCCFTVAASGFVFQDTATATSQKQQQEQALKLSVQNSLVGLNVDAKGCAPFVVESSSSSLHRISICFCPLGPPQSPVSRTSLLRNASGASLVLFAVCKGCPSDAGNASFSAAVVFWQCSYVWSEIW